MDYIVPRSPPQQEVQFCKKSPIPPNLMTQMCGPSLSKNAETTLELEPHDHPFLLILEASANIREERMEGAICMGSCSLGETPYPPVGQRRVVEVGMEGRWGPRLEGLSTLPKCLG